MILDLVLLIFVLMLSDLELDPFNMWYVVYRKGSSIPKNLAIHAELKFADPQEVSAVAEAHLLLVSVEFKQCF